MATLSTRRLFEATWSLVAVYFSILLADIARNSLVPIFLYNSSIGGRIWIVFPTIFMFLVSAFEAFLWLNPEGDQEIDIPLAYFIGMRLTT